MKFVNLLAIILIQIPIALPAFASLCAEFHQRQTSPSNSHCEMMQEQMHIEDNGTQEEAEHSCPICELNLCELESETAIYESYIFSSKPEIKSNSSQIAQIYSFELNTKLPQNRAPPYNHKNSLKIVSNWQASFEVYRN